MSLTQEQITRLAKLSSLSPNNSININSVVDSFDVIATVDTSSVFRATRSGKTELSLRPDVVVEDEKIPDALLKCSPQKIAAHQIVLAGIMQGE